MQHRSSRRSHVRATYVQMEMGTDMQARISVSRVIVPVACPIAVKVGDLNRVETRAGKIHILILCYIALTAVIVDDIHAADLDADSVIGSGTDVQDARGGDVDVTAETKGPIVQV